MVAPDERTRLLMEVVMMTKGRLRSQFNEQLDLYRKGEQMAVVTRFSDDQQVRYTQLASAVAYFGADEVVHASEAWWKQVEPDEVDGYRRGDLAGDAASSEVLVVLRTTKAETHLVTTGFREQDGDLVFDEPTELESDEPLEGFVIDAIRLGMREAWRSRLAPRNAAKTLGDLGLVVLMAERKR